MNKPVVDYYDRMADALEIISGDSSHIDDVDPNMDYYVRMANALDIIAQNGISSIRVQEHIVVSNTQPTNQQVGDIWLVVRDN